MKRVPKRPAPPVQVWMTYLDRARKTKYRAEPPALVLEKLGALVALVGPPADAEAQKVYRALSALFFGHRNPSRWHAAVNEIPPEPKLIGRIPACLRAYHRHVRKTLESRYPLERVVKVMVQVPESVAGQYVQDAAGGGLDRLGTVFHPNTLRAARKRLRGAFAAYDTEGEHADQLASKLKVVE